MPRKTNSRTSKPKTQPKAAPDFPHVRAAEGYVAGVLSGKIVACKQVRQACERHRRDMAASRTRKFPYKFDAAKANRTCKFMNLLPHTKGKWARKDPHTGEAQTIRLEPWQTFIVCSIFGWVRKSTGYRRFRKARLYVPRKNGKSIFAAAIGLFMMRLDNEPGAEIYCGATTEAQAREVWIPAKRMLQIDPELAEFLGITINAATLVGEDDGSKFVPVIGKPGDGSSPHCGIVDEYHEHKTSELIDTFETGMGARSQPLSLVTSTAGSDLAGPCREDWKLCERILGNHEGFQDETTFAIIYTIDPEDQWDTLEALQKANPNFGVSIDVDFLEAELNSARQNPNKQNRYKTKHLNLWVSARNAYYNVAKWNLLERKITREEFKEFPCYIAADFASHLDLTAVMQLFCLPEGRYALFGKYYLPAETIQQPQNQHYRTWHIQGHLETAGDSTMDFESLREDILSLIEEYDVLEFVIDPTRMWGEQAKYERAGVEVVAYRQQTLTMSQPMKDLEALIESGKIIHDGDPVLAWAIANVSGTPDPKDNVYPRKESAANKIDPAIGTMFALGRAATREQDAAGPLIYF